MKAAIIHGWSEGPWQSRRMRACLIQAGLTVVDDPTEADIVIAHSEGCYWLPIGLEARLVVLIGLPYWPGRSLLTSAILNLIVNAKTESRQSFAWWAGKLAHNIFYIFTRPQLTWALLAKHQTKNIPALKPRQKGLLLRAAQDTFCAPTVQQQLPKLKTYSFEQLSGVHDDCWMNPAPYVDLICKHL